MVSVLGAFLKNKKPVHFARASESSGLCSRQVRAVRRPSPMRDGVKYVYQYVN